MTRPNTDHVVVSFDSGEIRCLHCADFHAPATEIPGAVLIDRLRGFILMHRLCPKPALPSPQLDLPHTNGAIVSGAISREARASVALDNDPDMGTRSIEPPPDKLAELYPMAEDALELTDALKLVLPNPPAHLFDEVAKWHPRSGIFDAVAHWARCQKARADVGKTEPVPGLYIPNPEMPPALAELLEGTAKPTKKRSRTLRQEGRG